MRAKYAAIPDLRRIVLVPISVGDKLDSACSDQPAELTYVDMYTFLDSLTLSPTHVGLGTLRYPPVFCGLTVRNLNQ